MSQSRKESGINVLQAMSKIAVQFVPFRFSTTVWNTRERITNSNLGKTCHYLLLSFHWI